MKTIRTICGAILVGLLTLSMGCATIANAPIKKNVPRQALIGKDGIPVAYFNETISLPNEVLYSDDSIDDIAEELRAQGVEAEIIKKILEAFTERYPEALNHYVNARLGAVTLNREVFLYGTDAMPIGLTLEEAQVVLDDLISLQNYIGALD